MALEEASQLSSTSVFKVRETSIEHFRTKIVELKVIRYLKISPFLAPPAFEIILMLDDDKLLICKKMKKSWNFQRFQSHTSIMLHKELNRAQ